MPKPGRRSRSSATLLRGLFCPRSAERPCWTTSSRPHERGDRVGDCAAGDNVEFVCTPTGSAALNRSGVSSPPCVASQTFFGRRFREPAGAVSRDRPGPRRGARRSVAVLTSASDSGSVPGQRKRKRRQEAGRQRLAARTAPDAGRWEAVLETKDQTELSAHLQRLREEGIDESLVRIDTLCRRPVEQSTYRLSQFVATTVEKSDQGL